MRRTILAVVFGLLVIGLVAMGAPAASDPGFKTGKDPYLVPIDPASGVVTDPILSTGDIVGGYQMSGIPDGLGAYKDSGTIQLLMNHELGATLPSSPPLPDVDARISKLTLNDTTHGVLSATYLFNGNLTTEGYERFCSATLKVINGTPYYFTGEEQIRPTVTGHDGTSIVMNAVTGDWTPTPQFGHIQHENIVPVERINKFMAVTTDDDFRIGSPSLFLAYIAGSLGDAVAGHGQLYVWKATNHLTDTPATMHEGDSIPGEFVPLSQADNADSVTIKAAASRENAFAFSRLEDVTTAQQTPGRLYFADTGKIGDVSVTGRIYQMDIDPSDPAKASLTFLLDSATRGFANPDNLDTSAHSLVFQEDRESAFRGIPNRVLVYDFGNKTVRAVARVNTTPPLPPGQWESSGVINAQTLLGNNWWLLDVQAHSQAASQPGPTLPGLQPTPNTGVGEDGQLLAIYIPNS